MAVTFDGDAKLMILSSGTTSAEWRDLYSRWIDWLADDTGNAKYLPAFSIVGGDDLGGGEFAGLFFIVTNGWRVRPHEADHQLTLIGNAKGDAGASVVAPTVGDHQVTIEYRYSSLAQGVGIDAGAVANAVHGTVIEAGFRFQDVSRVVAAALAGRLSGAGTETIDVMSIDGSEVVIRAQVDSNGNRLAVSFPFLGD